MPYLYFKQLNFKLMETNIEIIENKINSIKETNKYIKKSKLQRLQYYKDNILKVNQMNFEIVNSYNFKNEILNHSINLQKLDLVPKIMKQIIKLEFHSYAPELNKLHFTKNRIIKTPKITNVENAINFLINTMHFDQLKELTK